MYSTENEEKSSVCEWWNRTIINTKMWKQFTTQGNTKYLDILPEILRKHNNTKHSSIKWHQQRRRKRRIKESYTSVNTVIWNHHWNRNSKSVTKLGLVSTRERYLIRVTQQIRQKKYPQWAGYDFGHLQVKRPQQWGDNRELPWTRMRFCLL